jgi:hypothetical protein
MIGTTMTEATTVSGVGWDGFNGGGLDEKGLFVLAVLLVVVVVVVTALLENSLVVVVVVVPQ